MFGLIGHSSSFAQAQEKARDLGLEEMAEAVRITDGRALLEASGGVNLDTVRAIAETGVDLISVGALTHSAGSMDISLDFDLR